MGLRKYKGQWISLKQSIKISRLCQIPQRVIEVAVSSGYK